MRSPILVVEPDTSTQLLLFRLLAEAGYPVALASDGAEAVATLETEPPALVLANVQCPGKSGLEVCSYAKALPQPLPVVLLAPGTDPEPIEGPDAVLGLPIDAARLLSAVAGLLGAEGPESPAGQERILVIDDDLGILNLLETILANEGFRVITADCGREGLAALEAENPHLILLDVQMPGLNGFEVLTRIRELRRDVPVIMVTAYGSEDVAADALRLGADDYMAKPLRVNNLTFRIQRNLEKARLRSAQEQLNRQLRQTTLTLTDRLQGLVEANAAAHQTLRQALGLLRQRIADGGETAALRELADCLCAAAEGEESAAAFAAVSDVVAQARGT
ncbi:MAG: response regulator [Candidatus Brocadiia bacterium]